MTAWCLAIAPQDIARTASGRWRLQGFVSRERDNAERMRPGDLLLYYAVGNDRWAAAVEVRSEAYEDVEPIWKHLTDDAYPWRVETRPLVVLDAMDAWVETTPRELEEGDLREVDDGEADGVLARLRAAAG